MALKLIAPEYAEDPVFRRRFLKEPRMAAALDHPNVVPIYEAREHGGQLYLAMRYVAGEDLKTRIARAGPLAPQQTIGVLAQVADALDAAHRRGLVHRDVKPANILLDEDGHAYLTDFGITKSVSSDSTATEHVVGTLDYLAPERIRGEEVDGRVDEYALACVLAECLAGTPPFRRESEAETMWAHLQSDRPRLPGHPGLDPVLAKGLAMEPQHRYATCTQLIEAARAVLVPPPEGMRAPRLVPALRRHRRAILAAGAALVAAAVAGIALSGEDAEPALAQVGNGVAAVSAANSAVTALVESATAPSNVAVGEGGAWVLNTQRSVVTRIDPKTKAVTATFETRGVPTDLAAGGGAVWLGNGGGRDANYTVGVSRIDPRTHKVTRTLKLPDKSGTGAQSHFNWGTPEIVVGAGAVWARNPDATISRIDPATGRLQAIVDVEADALAADRGNVWFLDGREVIRIDPRTNKPGQRISVGSPSPASIAVGGGMVWVVAEQEGVLWRVEPGPGPVTRSIDVGVGATYVAYGAGAVWTANFRDGRLTRVDPRTGAVEGRTPIGAAQSLAAGAGSAWVSTAGRVAAGPLPADVCGEQASGGPRSGTPRSGWASAWRGRSDTTRPRRARPRSRSGSRRRRGEAVVLGGDPYYGADRVVKALRDRLGRRVTIVAGFSFGAITDVLERLGQDARGIYVGTSDIPRGVLPLNATGRTRASVLRELRRTKVRDGILGSFAFDDNGDMTVADAPILRITGSTPPAAHLPPGLQGAVVDSVMRVPRSLAE